MLLCDHSSRTIMTTSVALSPVTSAAAWRGDKLLDKQDWIYHLNENQIGELEALGRRFLEDDPDLRFVKASDYPLKACAAAVEEWCKDIDEGRGFVLARGLRTHLYSD